MVSKIPPRHVSCESTDSLLQISSLSFAYDAASPILNELNLSLGYGQAIGVTGANGSGKTTLFRCITGLEKFVSGEMRFLGKVIKKKADFAYLRAHTGFVLQNPENQFVFPTVLEDVMFGPLNLGHSAADAHERAHAILDRLEISKFASRIIFNLSGGEKKLVALAGILAMQPDLLLLDEPLNELDSRMSEKLIFVLQNLKCSTIIVSHDTKIFNELGCRIFNMRNGKLQEEPNS